MYEEPTFYLWYDFVLSLISIPLNLFTLYCIVRKSPVEMKEYQPYLIFYQLITFSTEFILLLIRPELFFPAFAGRIFGLWETLLGLDAKLALTVGSFFVVYVGATLNQLFFYKWQNLLSQTSRFKIGSFGRIVYRVLTLLIYPVYMPIVFQLLPIQKGLSTEYYLEAIQEHPEFQYFSNVSTIYVAGIRPIFPPNINFSAIPLILMGVAFAATFLAILNSAYIYACNYLLVHVLIHISKRTRQQQKKFFMSLVIQLSIPFAALSVPWLYYGAKLSILTDSTNQPLNNLCFGVLSSHGTASSLTLLLLTDPYRRFIESLLRKLPYGEKLMKLFTKQQHVVSVSITQ